MSVADLARLHPRAAEWADDFVLSREMVGAAERARLYRRAQSGQLVTVRPGVFLPAGRWTGLTADDRYLVRIRAAALTARSPLVFAGLSGGALWRLPIIGQWPQRPVVLAERAAGGRSTRTLERRCTALPAEIWVVDGLATLGLPEVVVDVARHASFGVAVAMADRALAKKTAATGGVLGQAVSKSELFDALTVLDVVHGGAKALAVIEFADGESGSAGESISRVVIYRLGFAMPLLQFEFRDAQGRIVVDFWWPDLRLVGEFDGKGKYVRDEYTGGRSTAEVVLAENERENRLRALGPTVVRWGWAEAMSPPILRRKLLAAGVSPSP